MECNKEEAIRAKEIAEKKMQTQDFSVARRIVLKAQKLFPNLENIFQMQTVCDVHYASEQKVSGTEMDWYGILQIEQTADETAIKKQYRKLALLLHPDKNRFPGAEAAFKLLGEAQRILLDPVKRKMHDMRRNAPQKATLPKQSQPQSNGNNARKPEVPANNVMNPHQQKQQQTTQPEVCNSQQTFWTTCYFCDYKYEYYRRAVNKALQCQNCLKTFVAYDLYAQGVPQGPKKQPSVPKKKGPAPDGPKKGSESTVRNSPSNSGLRGNNEKVAEPFTNMGGTSNAGVDSQSKGKEEINHPMDEGQGKKEMNMDNKPSGNRKRNLEESGESCDTGRNRDTDGDSYAGVSSGDNPRRSSRRKQADGYNEAPSDKEDIVGSSKRAKQNGPLDTTKEHSGEFMKGDASRINKPFDFDEDKAEKEKTGTPLKEGLQNGKDKYEECTKMADESNNGLKTKPVPGTLEVPDPDFYDFDRDKKIECFGVDQMWACYDDVDGMPRFYAKIRKVNSCSFRVRITWLEPYSDDRDGIKWINQQLPVGCGNYIYEKSEDTEDIGMFSHRVDWEKGPRGLHKIYPRIGETWAVFKNWDINWSSDPNTHRKYEYEFVEVLSDYNQESGIRIAYLVKVKGFVSLFKPNNRFTSFMIPPSGMLRFAHRVPSFRTTGTEREDVPQGYFELDPASLPSNIEDIPVTIDVKENVQSVDTNNEEISGIPMEKIFSCSDQVKNHYDSVANGNGALRNPSSPSNLVSAGLLEAVFHNFEDDKSREKFQTGQIWALYCDLDAFPKFYAEIKKVELFPDFKVKIRWLESKALPKGTIKWLDKEMPICSGTFMYGEDNEFSDTAVFSHLSRGVTTKQKNTFEIYPRKGEVWALYKNFNPELSSSDLGNCEYDIVEVLEEKVQSINVSVLKQVAGYETVFRSEREAGQDVTMEILRVELLRFSHQIPAFRLIDERNGKLQSCLELDPKALPVYLLSSD